MQFQVPQFIETEDKIVGPLTLKQFAYIAGGGILSALLYFVAQAWLWAIGSFFIFAIVIALAFVKIEGRPFPNVIVSAFHFYWKPQTYVWQPEHPTVVLHPKVVEQEASRSALEEILAKSAAKTRATIKKFTPAAKPVEPAKPITRETVKTGSALHKSWEDVQTGAPLTKKNSDKQFLERKMAERYQIFQRLAGDRNAAKRIDYR
jgi:hypothetical protein